MINHAVIMGRLTNDPELRTTQSGVSVTSFTVAVERSFRSGGERQTDFINCVAWRNTADFVSNYFHKGQMIAVEGSIQTRSYEDNNGNKRYVVEIVASNVSFCGSKNENAGAAAAPAQETAPAASYQSTDAGSFSVLPDDESQGFPFSEEDDNNLPF
ncbi:MAG: single-stranded DNA-binding protein [Clostridiales bacterium]|nr:single-stranded DNA-binding protein [Clostridiales bacterium]